MTMKGAATTPAKAGDAMTMKGAATTPAKAGDAMTMKGAATTPAKAGAAMTALDQRGAAIFCSIAPNTLCPSAPFISIRIVSPNFMNSVEGWPSWMVSMARFSAMQL
jgi:hypothetical protein